MPVEFLICWYDARGEIMLGATLPALEQKSKNRCESDTGFVQETCLPRRLGGTMRR